ncbi:MxaK protein [Ideonella sp. A 288]|uniref:MxaK protein n=1 Tax=Ideonella sp. A 288 TaxID=1962181 RepID=UPI000B4A9566|nr:MxaK protein [Ideonella sp. A 288]
MKRLSVHGVFAVAALIAGGIAAGLALRLQQVEQLNAAITAAARLPPAADGKPLVLADPGWERSASPEARLARATALAAAGAHDAAFKAYSELVAAGVDVGEQGAVGRHALFNLGNMLLRQGLGAVPGVGDGTGRGGDVATPLPPRAGGDAGTLVELAKQRYRDLLRVDPLDWDARYNLERALRRAPEAEEAVAEPDNVPVERRRVQLRSMDAGDLP